MVTSKCKSFSIRLNPAYQNITLLSLITLVTHANAGQLPAKYMVLEAGASFVQHNTRTVIETMPMVNLPDNYSTSIQNNNGLVGLGFGYTLALPVQNSVLSTNRIGIFYDYYFATGLTGSIEKWQAITAYTYSFNNNSNTLWLDDQLDLFNWNNIVPFLELGAGASWNRAYGYNETPVPQNPLPDRRIDSASFASNTVTSFAWRAGAGVNLFVFWLPDQFHLGVLYRYVDRGTIKTGASANYPTVTNGIGAKIRSNDVVCTLTYHF